MQKVRRPARQLRGGRTWWAAGGLRGSNPDSCWCQRFCEHDASSNQDALRCELDEAVIPVALLVYVDDQPAGWTRVIPRRTVGGICGNRGSDPLLPRTTPPGGSPASRSEKSTVGSVSEERYSTRLWITPMTMVLPSAAIAAPSASAPASIPARPASHSSLSDRVIANQPP